MIEDDIKTGTSSKRYIVGFTGFTRFAEVIGSKMKIKLKNEKYVDGKVSAVVYVNYNQSLSLQIESRLLDVINRIKQPLYI